VSTSAQWRFVGNVPENYERRLVPSIFAPWAAEFVELAALRPGERVLDVACGTGVVARIAAQRVGPGGRVVGVDLNPGMIDVAGSLPTPVGAPIEWLERSAVNLLLPDASFDVVLCQQGLQFFPDKLVALWEMRRVLVHGGRLALSVWNSTGLYNAALGEALARFVGNEAGTKFCASRQVPAKEDLQRLATEAGFCDVEVRVNRLDIHLPRLIGFILDHLAATPVAPFIAATGPEVRKQIGASVMKQMQRYADGDGVTYPEETHVMTAQVR